MLLRDPYFGMAQQRKSSKAREASTSHKKAQLSEARCAAQPQKDEAAHFAEASGSSSCASQLPLLSSCLLPQLRPTPSAYSNMSALLEEPSQDSWDLKAHRIDIPAHAGPSQFASSSSLPAEDKEDEGGFFYIPNFISEDEERFLTEALLSAPKPKWKVLQNRRLQEWGGQVHAKNNTLMPQAMPDFFAAYPDLVTRLRKTGAFERSKHGEPNHCLVNEYLSGQGIMPHEDGPAYFPAVATISLGSHTLLDIYRYVDEDLQKDFDERMKEHDESVAAKEGGAKDEAEANKDMDLSKSKIVPKERVEGDVKIVRGARAREPNPVFSILQEPRSLLVTTGKVYK